MIYRKKAIKKEGFMTTEQRRENILNYFKENNDPVSANVLAAKFHVSRQIIVGDVAILRAAGHDIAATPRGYLLLDQAEEGIRRQIVSLHTAEQIEEELNICVDYGCEVLDVIIDHPVYGQLSGRLQIRSRYDVMQFMKKVKEEQAHSLSELTDGVHMHTLVCPGEKAYEQAVQKLEQAGILFRE